MSRLAASVVALDFDATAATHAAATYPGVPAVRGNLVRLPFADSSFDLVVSLQTVEHLWDQEAAWEPRHGDLVRAQLASGAPAAWDRDLRQLVASVSTADFEVDAAHDSCLDLVAVVTRPTEPEQG
jgi:SAM-dependent methyltransferase